MYNICICDDDVLFSNMLQTEIQNYFDSKQIMIQIHIFNCGADLKNSLQKYDLFFLDVRLPDITGLDLALHIRLNGTDTPIIFISNIPDAVYDSLRFRPLRFIRKEFITDELADALDAFIDCESHSSIQLMIKTSKGTTMLMSDSILQITAIKHYLEIFHKDEIYKIRGGVSAYETMLKDFYFVRVNHGTLVNLKYVVYVRSNNIQLSNGNVVSLTRTYRENFSRIYLSYQRQVLHAIHV